DREVHEALFARGIARERRAWGLAHVRARRQAHARGAGSLLGRGEAAGARLESWSGGGLEELQQAKRAGPAWARAGRGASLRAARRRRPALLRVLVRVRARSDRR